MTTILDRVAMHKWGYGWDWATFKGTPTCLHWSMRDLGNLEAVLARTPGRTAVVQAGANLGIFPKHLARQFESVYTFEPAAELWPLLLHNAPEGNIYRYHAALGDVRRLVRTRRVRRDPKALPTHEGLTHTQPGGLIPTLRIDDLGLPVCDLIYLDIEGDELAALHGAVETLARCRPVVAVEINKIQAIVGLGPTEIPTFLARHGYRHVDQQKSDHVFMPREAA